MANVRNSVSIVLCELTQDTRRNITTNDYTHTQVCVQYVASKLCVTFAAYQVVIVRRGKTTPLSNTNPGHKQTHKHHTRNTNTNSHFTFLNARVIFHHGKFFKNTRCSDQLTNCTLDYDI